MDDRHACLAALFLALATAACGGTAVTGTAEPGAPADPRAREESHRLAESALEAVARGDLDAALASAEDAIAADPSNPDAYHIRGALLSHLGETEQAYESLARAAELETDNGHWQFEAAGKAWEMYQAETGEGADAWLVRVETYIDAAIEHDGPGPESRLLRARCHKARYRFHGAAADYTRAIEQDPLDVQVYLELGRLYILAGRVFFRSDLEDLAERVLALPGRTLSPEELSTEAWSVLPDLTFERAQLRLWRANTLEDPAAKRSLLQEAIGLLWSIEDEYRDRSMLMLQLAQAYQLAGDPERACTAARETLAGLSPADPGLAILRDYVAGLEFEACTAAATAETPPDAPEPFEEAPAGPTDASLPAAPDDLPDQPPPERVGEAWTMFGLWRITQEPERNARAIDVPLTVRGYIVRVDSGEPGPDGDVLSPHVWLADQPSTAGLYFPLAGYADSHAALAGAAAYDRCIEACTAEKGDPRADTVDGMSRTFGDCLADVTACRDLSEADPRAHYFTLSGRFFGWHLFDSVFGPTGPRDGEEPECAAASTRRRALAVALAVAEADVDLARYRRDVRAEAREQDIDARDPTALRPVSDRYLATLGDETTVGRMFERLREVRAGTDDGAELLRLPGAGRSLREALGDESLADVADELLDELLVRWFYSRADRPESAAATCLRDDGLDFTSAYSLEPIDLVTRQHAMLGPVSGTTWEQALAAGQPFELRGVLTSRSRTGFLGWTIDLTPELVCSIGANCPEGPLPLFGDE